ncbi:hypothetical protein PRZ48_002234 [Zasmidium cellare]|uniref:Uncharacterized protein n=1 Tax=Zasmidium cellare TaxID=395010 RepID=A0ABR0F573_ZASCE|nr:hypothetical protein PRZ48_002234 [Zasmidium cellare]
MSSGIGGLPWLTAIIHDRLHPPADPQPDLSNRTVLITGANTGVGFEAALKFVALGAAKVILGVRSLKKGEDAKVSIEARTGRKGVVEVWGVDMGDYGSLRGFVGRVERVDVAVLNAGVARMGFEEGGYGWESTLQVRDAVNTLSTTLLAILLLPKLRASKTASFTPVLELVSSGNHTQVLIADSARKADSPLEVYNSPTTYDGLNQYSISRLFLQFIQTGLVHHIGPVSQSHVEVVTVCPGATKSELARGDLPFALRVFQKVFYTLLMKPTEQGARTPAPTLTGPENEKLQQKVWQDVLRILRKDVPEVDGVLASVAASKNSIRESRTDFAIVVFLGEIDAPTAHSFGTPVVIQNP